MPSTPHSLVLGFAAGLPAAAFRPFVDSLRATDYRGRFGLITAKCTPEQNRELAELADLHWDVDDLFKSQGELRGTIRALRVMRSRRGLRRMYPATFQATARIGNERVQQARWEHLEYELEGLQSLRYWLYYRFLRDIAPDADVILLSDLRDVIFQADPFDAPVTGLEFYLEDEKSRLGTETFNSRWIRNLYGSQHLARLARECTSCSGTTVGERIAILDYLVEMDHAISWRRRPLGAHDQGVHNFLIRTGRFPGGKLVPNGHGRVLTMGLLESVSVTEDVVLNSDGTVPAVLHQYDRHPRLAQQLVARVRRLDRD